MYHSFTAMCFFILSVSVLSVCCAQDSSDSAAEETLTITITNPDQDGTTVKHRHRVHGTVSDPDAVVWLIILAEETGDYFPQPRVTINKAGDWSVLAFFGEASTAQETPFVIRAFANPETDLKTGVPLEYWPEAEAASNIIAVQR